MSRARPISIGDMVVLKPDREFLARMFPGGVKSFVVERTDRETYRRWMVMGGGAMYWRTDVRRVRKAARP